MLDYRVETFLCLCELLNYTKTAEKLCITQPAVTQHIHFLEDEYNCKLFTYNKRTLTKTTEGIELEHYLKSMKHNELVILKRLSNRKDVPKTLYLGATKTIGEYVIGDKIARFLQGNNNITLYVENTQALLKRLENSEINLALIEGYFDKRKYNYSLYKMERFIGVCSKTHPFANKEIPIDELFDNRLILREDGSGTREIFEQVLHEYSYSISNFAQLTQVSNFSVIVNLIKQNLGISFMYESVVKNDDTIATFEIDSHKLKREFNYITLKDTIEDELVKKFIQI